jgi:hypothetical protein
LLINVTVDAMYACTTFQGTWFCLPSPAACNWLHASLRYVACSLMCSGPLFTCGHLGAITTKNAFSRVKWLNCPSGYGIITMYQENHAFSNICSELCVVLFFSEACDCTLYKQVGHLLYVYIPFPVTQCCFSCRDVRKYAL